MKTILKLTGLVLVFLWHVNYAQSCLPDGITFTSQLEVDNFQKNYPGCVKIEGSVVIDSDHITNLHGLNAVDHIGGDLVSEVNDSLVNFDGLGSLNEIGGSLRLWGNHSLLSLDGFNKLTKIGKHLVIAYHPHLYDLLALSNTEQLGGNLTVVYNDSVKTLDGLQNIDSASIDQLNIYHNPSLSSCAIKSTCDFIGISYADADIYSNDENCNTVSEVEAACKNLSVHDFSVEPYFLLYPIPANECIHIQLADIYIIEKITLSDITGKVLKTLHTNNRTVSVNGMKTGIYFLECTVENQKIRRKFILN